MFSLNEQSLKVRTSCIPINYELSTINCFLAFIRGYSLHYLLIRRRG